MYILRRKISEYTDRHQLLGVFRTQVNAEEAKQVYCRQLQSGEISDPWEKQAYHKVDLEKDLVVEANLRTTGSILEAGQVSVISSYAEGFGQIVRKFEAICETPHDAENIAREIEAADNGNFPFYCEVDRMIVGDLTYGQLNWNPYKK